MRHLRAKQGRKTLAYFRISFGIAPPYAVLVDGNFIHTACSFNIDLHARISKHIGDKYKLCVPSTVVKELKTIGKAVENSLEFVQTYCEEVSGEGVFESPSDEIKSLVGKVNSLKYLVATQESELRDYLRYIPGVPLLHIQRTVLLLESPSSNSRKASKTEEADKMRKFDVAEEATLKTAHKLRLQERAEKRRQDGSAAPAPKKVKAKGANPLSCLKKKVIQKPSHEVEVMSGTGKKKTRRKQKKIGA